MKAKHAAEIRKGIVAANEVSAESLMSTVAMILNSRYYSSLALEAFNRTLVKRSIKMLKEVEKEWL